MSNNAGGLPPELIAELDEFLAATPPLGPVQIELLTGVIARLLE